MPDTSNSDSLELLLSTRFEGLDTIAPATEGIRKYASAERANTKAMKAAVEAQKELTEARKVAKGMGMPFDWGGRGNGGGRGGGGGSRTPKEPPTMAQSIVRAIQSSRFSVDSKGGVNFMPLIGQVMKTGLGPLAIVGGIALKVADYLEKCGESARKAAHDFEQVTVTTAGNRSTAAKLSVLGKVGGTDLDEQAQGLNDRLSGNDPRTMFWAQRLGLSLRPGMPGRPVDKGARAIHAIEQLRAMKLSGKLSDAQEGDALESMGMTGSRDLVDATPEDYNLVQRQIRLKKRLSSPDVRAFTLHQDMRERLMKEQEELTNQQIGNQYNQTVGKARQGIQDAHRENLQTIMDPTIDKAKFNKGSLGLDVSALLNLIGGKGGVSVPTAASMGVLAGPEASAGTGTGTTTEAIMLLVSTLLSTNKSLQAMIGGGANARNAIPGSLGGRFLMDAINQGALHQGALG